MQPIPAQIDGAAFLAARTAALLADKPGFGKTAQAVLACDKIQAKRILVVTTASARANWLAEFRLWSKTPRKGFACYSMKGRIPDDAEIVVLAWSNVSSAALIGQIVKRTWDVLILDESHYAKSATAARTKAVYGPLTSAAPRVWCLTGTPVPNTPLDLWPMLRALFRDRPVGALDYQSFVDRYVRTRPMWFGGRRVDVPQGAKNTEELRDALRPIMLRRDQSDLPPIRHAVYTLHADAMQTEDVDQQAILEAAALGDTMSVDMHMGPLRRLTGVLKAEAVVPLIAEELTDSPGEKIVLFHWHTEVGQILRDGLRDFGAVGIDGSVPGSKRQPIVERFQTDRACRVFVAQIVAAGEAITLTAAAQCMYVEASFVPKDMQQSVRRIFRRGQTRPCLCRVAALEGSIDEALMRIVTGKMAGIREITEVSDAC